MPPNETITIETRIKDESIYPILDEFNYLFNTVKRKLFVDVYVRKVSSLKDLKRDYLAKYDISGRHFNSIHSCLKSQINSLEELTNKNSEEKTQLIKKLDKKIRKLRSEINGLKEDIKKIERYRLLAKRYKKGEVKKPQLLARLKNKNLKGLKEKVKNTSFTLHQKSRKKIVELHKLCKLQERQNKAPKICFGSLKVFKQQFYLRENKLKNHEEWEQLWRDSRNTSSYWVGSHDESYRNQNAQYDHKTNMMRLRLPNCLSVRYLSFEADFKYKKDQLIYALTEKHKRYSKKKKQDMDMAFPVSYRILKRGEIYYLQAIFERPPVQKTTLKGTGAIGIDFNMNHLAVTETDRFGNPIWRASHYFDLDQKNSEKNKSQLSNYLSMIVQKAKKERKLLVCENLNFEKKKIDLKSVGSKRFRHLFSSMAYSEYLKLLETKCHASGVKLKRVNAAYTSLIGVYKFAGYKNYTSHELAALCIARRGLNMSERLKSKVTFLEPVRILDFEKVSSEKKIKHVWSFWSRLKNTIRAANNISTTYQRVESINPFYPPWVTSDLNQSQRYSIRDFDNHFRRYHQNYYQWVRGKYCSFPVTKGHPLVEKSIRRFG